MNKAFTVVELIFVIVIIGILAAVAVPKLAATRHDAKISTEVRNLKQVINNLGVEFSAQNSILDSSYAEAQVAIDCFTITKEGDNEDGNFTLSVLSESNSVCGLQVLESVKKLATNVGLLGTGGASKVFTLSGASILK